MTKRNKNDILEKKEKWGAAMPTISFRKSSRHTNIRHNNRERIPKNADPTKSKDNVYFNLPIQEVYNSVFSEAVADYNSQQKRNDRKIDNYYKKTLHDKKTREQQELIVQVGDFLDVEKNPDNWDKFEDILIEYVNGFQKRNPQLALYNAALHQDEATPHLHLNFVPFANYEKGLKRRVNFEKSLKQQGFEDFASWRLNETDVLEKLMNEKGLEREYVGSHKYAEIKDYKIVAREVEKKYQKEILRLKSENEKLKERNQDIIDTYEKERKKLIAENIELSKQLKNADKIWEWVKSNKSILEQYREDRFNQLVAEGKDPHILGLTSKYKAAYTKWQHIGKTDRGYELY